MSRGDRRIGFDRTVLIIITGPIPINGIARPVRVGNTYDTAQFVVARLHKYVALRIPGLRFYCSAERIHPCYGFIPVHLIDLLFDFDKALAGRKMTIKVGLAVFGNSLRAGWSDNFCWTQQGIVVLGGGDLTVGVCDS